MSKRKREAVARNASAIQAEEGKGITTWKKFISVRNFVIAVAVLLLLGLAAIGALSEKFKQSFIVGSRISTNSAAESQPAVTNTPQLSKEYIYAGGEMLAIEEAGSGSSGGGGGAAPTNLVATGNATQVAISWNAPTSGNVNRYEVERGVRGASGQIEYTQVAACQYIGTGTSCSDTGVESWRAYLYRVRAIDASNNTPSDYSNIDLATTFSFTDDPLVARSTQAKAQHINELRQAVDAVRALKGLATNQWSEAVAIGTWIKAQHITELRAKLNEVRSALGLKGTSYEDPDLAAQITIKAVHITQLRDGVK